MSTVVGTRLSDGYNGAGLGTMGWRPVPMYRAHGRLVATIAPGRRARTNAASSERAYDGDAYARAAAPSSSIFSTKSTTDAIKTIDPTPRSPKRITDWMDRDPDARSRSGAPTMTSSRSTAMMITAEGNMGATNRVSMLDPDSFPDTTTKIGYSNTNVAVGSKVRQQPRSRLSVRNRTARPRSNGVVDKMRRITLRVEKSGRKSDA